MNKVDFFGHQITKLIIGDNPINGHSYIEDVTTGEDMKKHAQEFAAQLQKSSGIVLEVKEAAETAETPADEE